MLDACVWRRWRSRSRRSTPRPQRRSPSRSATTRRCRSPGRSTNPAPPRVCWRASTRCGKSRAARAASSSTISNGPLYILDKETKKFTTYLDFNGREGPPGSSTASRYATSFANGLVTVQFDPDYRRNGRFYTVHIEDPAVNEPPCPTTRTCPASTSRLPADRRRRRRPGRFSAKACSSNGPTPTSATRRSKARRESCCGCSSTRASIRWATWSSTRPRAPATPSGA